MFIHIQISGRVLSLSSKEDTTLNTSYIPRNKGNFGWSTIPTEDVKDSLDEDLQPYLDNLTSLAQIQQTIENTSNLSQYDEIEMDETKTESELEPEPENVELARDDLTSGEDFSVETAFN